MKFLIGIFLACALTGAAQTETFAGESPQQRAARLAWWRDGRFGMFIHWGPVSLKGTEISWSRGGERRGIGGSGEIPVEVYDNLYKQFNPVLFDASEWVAIARSAGMKYMVLTAKHCDGFCLWRSAVDPYCIAHSPFERDVCGELARAAQKAGMRIGWYYSPMDWRDPDCRTERNAVYLTRMRGHLRELLSNYGRIDLLWFDADGGPAVWDQHATYALVRGLQHEIIINDRLSLGPYETIDKTRIDPNADYRTPEQRVGAFDRRIPWETCMTLGTQWSWKPDDKIKRASTCIRILAECATGDGNLLLDVGPMPDGRIEPRQVEVLKEIGAWLTKYGESIYGTRGGPYCNGVWGGATCRGNIAYIHVTRWNGDHIALPALPAHVVRSTALTGGHVQVTQSPGGVTLRMPVGEQDSVDTIVKIELDSPAEEIMPIAVEGMSSPLLAQASASIAAPPETQFAGQGARSLIDGVRGTTDRMDGAWLGFAGRDFEAVVDLHRLVRIHRIAVGCLQEQVSRIFFPRKIEVSVAGDDSLFHSVGSVDGGASLEDAQIRSKDFSVTFDSSAVRFVKVAAANIRTCPPWHPEAGAQALLLIDEISVE
ncbi:MAG TPA: alpha-L-fucosidase [Bacteroidota bacterium]|nr:alpha-L-fucosidase [Bacteroidota bacterium]